MSGTLRGPVLVVEDHADFREALTALLEAANYRVIAVGDGAQGLDFLRVGEPPCAVILDLHMPRVDGWQFLEAVRATAGKNIPVMVITGTAPPETTAATLGLPVEHCFLKPCEPEALVRALAPHCRANETRQAS